MNSIDHESYSTGLDRNLSKRQDAAKTQPLVLLFYDFYFAFSVTSVVSPPFNSIVLESVL